MDYVQSPPSYLVSGGGANDDNVYIHVNVHSDGLYSPSPFLPSVLKLANRRRARGSLAALRTVGTRGTCCEGGGVLVAVCVGAMCSGMTVTGDVGMSRVVMV